MEGDGLPSWDSDDLISYIPSNHLGWMSFIAGYGLFVRSSFSEAYCFIPTNPLEPLRSSRAPCLAFLAIRGLNAAMYSRMNFRSNNPESISKYISPRINTMSNYERHG